MDKPTIGFALCGSFCTFEKAINEMEELKSSAILFVSPLVLPAHILAIITLTF